MKNFWQELEKPIFILAPMDDVTDTVLRQMIAKTARPDVFFTEFTSVDALCSKGREKVLHRLKFSKSEHPIVAQIWGTNPQNFYSVSKDIVKMGFDGIDINMGCPVRDIITKGACSGLIKNPQKAREIIEAVQKGVEGKIPVSVKTRLGFNKIETIEWIGFLLSLNLDAIIIHARTAKEMSKVAAHWDEIKKAVDLKNKMGSKTLIIGNGDVTDRADGLKKIQETTCDGVMIGRGIFKNVWAFEKTPKNHSLKTHLKLLTTHAKLFQKTWGKNKNFLSLRKFFKSYIHSFEGANDLRINLMVANNLSEVINLVETKIDH